MYDYEEFHKKYDVSIHDDPARHIKVASLCKGVVYDIGCGTGTLSDYFTGPYLGLDIAHSAIEKTKEVRRKTAMFEVMDATKLQNEDFSKADTIVMSEFLEHIKDDSQLFAAIIKTACIGTRLVISVPNGSNFDCDEHVRQFTVPQLRKKLAVYGRVKFYNWSGAAGQIICTVELGEPQRADLSLVMIVRNEEKGLEKALLSSLDYVDEIIVAVDDASTDKSGEIASRYADVVKRFEWVDNFAAARNLVHDGAMGKWCLFLDVQEYIKQEEGLEKALASEADGLMCKIEMENEMEFNNPRIYKNGIHFEGAVHEKQVMGRVEFYPQFVIVHDRLGSQSEKAAEERKKQRDDMVPRIMGKQYKENKRNTRATFHLGLHYCGRQNTRLAVRWFRRYLRYSQVAGERWFVYFELALLMMIKNKLFRAFWYAELAENETPGRWEIRKLKGLILFAKNKPQQALEYLLTSFYENKERSDYKPWQHDDGGTLNVAGECLYRLGQYAKAAEAWRAGAEQTKDEIVKKLLTDRANLMGDLLKN